MFAASCTGMRSSSGSSSCIFPQNLCKRRASRLISTSRFCRPCSSFFCSYLRASSSWKTLLCLQASSSSLRRVSFCSICRSSSSRCSFTFARFSLHSVRSNSLWSISVCAASFSAHRTRNFWIWQRSMAWFISWYSLLICCSASSFSCWRCASNSCRL